MSRSAQSAFLARKALCVEKIWVRSSAGLERSPVTREVAGSSPVGPVFFPWVRSGHIHAHLASRTLRQKFLISAALPDYFLASLCYPL